MTDNRLILHQRLVDILGSKEVYFQAPVNIRMSYPAIVYQLYDIRTKKADNRTYNKMKRYQITYITKDPDSEVIDKIEAMLYTSFDRFFVVEQLNHYNYTTYI